MAGALVESLHDRFQPEAFADTYRERVLELIEAKAKGEEPELPEPEEPQQPADLIAALEASLHSGRGRPESARAPAGRKPARSAGPKRAKARS
jgi:DNA end-binding protein Ku